MTTLQLFYNSKIDNINKVSNFADVNAQNSYYNGLSDKKEFETTFNKLGDSMIISGSPDDVLKYNYGRVKLKNYWYYFGVLDFKVNQTNRTEIVYSIDCWETSHYQFGVTLSNGIVERTKATIGLQFSQDEIQPISTKAVGLFSLSSPNYFTDTAIYLLLILYDSTANNSEMYFIYYPDYIPRNFIGDSVTTLFKLAFPSRAISDIRGVYIVPNVTINGNFQSIYTKDTGEIVYKYNNKYYGYSFFTTITGKIEVTDTHKPYLGDGRKNPIYYFKKGVEYNEMYCKLVASYNFAKFIIDFFIGSENKYYESITYPLDSISIMGDAYNEYFVRQRDTDINLRELQNQKELVSGLVNVGQGGLSGGLIGASAGAAGIGAIAGVALSAASSIGTYAMNSYFNNQEQNIYDKQYKKAKDDLSLYGEGNRWQSGLGVYCDEWDSISIQRYNENVNSRGYLINYPTTNAMTFYVGLLKGNFQVDGPIPMNWKAQIRERFSNGCVIID